MENKEDPRVLRRMIRLAQEESKPLLLGTFFLLLGSGTNLSFPMIIGMLVDGIADGGGR